MAQLGSTVINGELRVNGDVYADNLSHVYTTDTNPVTDTSSSVKVNDVWIGGDNSGSDVPVTQTDVQRLDAELASQKSTFNGLISQANSSISSTNTRIDNINIISSYTVPTTGWASATDNKKTVYVYTIALNSVYVNVPDVWYSGTSDAMALAYSKLYKVTIDKDAKKLKLYSVSVPGSSYIISVRGVK